MWTCSLVWIRYLPPKEKIMGSNPIRSVFLITLIVKTKTLNIPRYTVVYGETHGNNNTQNTWRY